MGVLLYDADRIPAVAAAADEDLLDAQFDMILDPFDPEVIEAAQVAGVGDGRIEAAQRSPAYKLVKKWKIALPLHAEYRTLAMMFYTPPLSPLISTVERSLVRLDLPDEQTDFELFHELDKGRLPIRYLANLFSVGDEQVIRRILRKLLAVRIYKRRQSVAGEIDQATLAMIEEAGSCPTEIEEIYRLTTVATLDERFVLPPYDREVGIEALRDPLTHKGETGLGCVQPPRRGK
jgi:nitrate reductase beta subunit